MKLAVIFTGGTIGSKAESGVIGTQERAAYRLIEGYEQSRLYQSGLTWDTFEPYTILSENLNGTYLTQLIGCVGDCLQTGQYAGIIVTHGTDTLQYAAAVLQSVFAASPTPILLVSANYVLDDPKTNGWANFSAAVDFIKGGYGQGVFVSYRNPDGITYIHRGSRLQPAIPMSDAVMSANDQWYGQFVDGDYCANACFAPRSEDGAVIEDAMAHYRDIRLSEYADAILWLKCYPGMRHRAIPKNVRYILLDSYHSGTIAINLELAGFAEEAREHNIPIYLLGLPEAEAEYATVNQYRKLGIRPLPGAASIAVYCRLWIETSMQV